MCSEWGGIPDLPARPKPVEGGGRAYKCAECGREFPVHPNDPIDAHEEYLDHLGEHECTCEWLDDMPRVRDLDPNCPIHGHVIANKTVQNDEVPD